VQIPAAATPRAVPGERASQTNTVQHHAEVPACTAKAMCKGMFVLGNVFFMQLPFMEE